MIELNTDTKLEDILAKFSYSMKRIFKEKLKGIMLYGSYARNQQDNESDIYIMVLVDEDKMVLKKYHKSVVNITSDLDLEFDVVISVIVQNYDEYNKYVDILPFFSNVRKESVLINA